MRFIAQWLKGAVRGWRASRRLVRSGDTTAPDWSDASGLGTGIGFQFCDASETLRELLDIGALEREAARHTPEGRSLMLIMMPPSTILRFLKAGGTPQEALRRTESLLRLAGDAETVSVPFRCAPRSGEMQTSFLLLSNDYAFFVRSDYIMVLDDWSVVARGRNSGIGIGNEGKGGN